MIGLTSFFLAVIDPNLFGLVRHTSILIFIILVQGPFQCAGSTITSETLCFVDCESADGRGEHFLCLHENERYISRLQNVSYFN